MGPRKSFRIISSKDPFDIDDNRLHILPKKSPSLTKRVMIPHVIMPDRFAINSSDVSSKKTTLFASFFQPP